MAYTNIKKSKIDGRLDLNKKASLDNFSKKTAKAKKLISIAGLPKEIKKK